MSQVIKPSEDQRQVYDPEYHANEQFELAHHILKVAKSLGMFPKTNDRPWNTYFRRPFSGLVNTNIEVFRVPAGRYLVLERVIFGPVAHAITGPSGFMIDQQNNVFDAMYAASAVVPIVALAASENQMDVFVNEGESVNYVGIGTASDTITGCIFGRLILKDIQEGLDITLPDTEESSPYPLQRMN